MEPIFLKLIQELEDLLKVHSAQAIKPVIIPPTPAIAVMPPTAVAQQFSYLFDTHDNAEHSTRVICDEILGVSATMTIDGKVYKTKDIICACIEDESHFDNNVRPHQNRNGLGKILSTDYGIVQVNDFYHIGVGKDFPSVIYVLDNPERCVRWMVQCVKEGHISWWCSFSGGAYKQFMPQ